MNQESPVPGLLINLSAGTRFIALQFWHRTNTVLAVMKLV